MAANSPQSEREQPDLHGVAIAITGRLMSMSRGEAIAAIEKAKAVYLDQLNDRVRYLVVGQLGWPLSKDGHLTQHLQSAQQRKQSGQEIEILSEEAFLGLLGLDETSEGVRRLYTTEQLSRVLKIEPRLIRSWIRAGLIEPAKRVHRLAYFNFEQVARAKALIDLSRSGVTPHRLQKSLEQLHAWLPDAAQTPAQLGLLEEGGRLLVRLANGQLAEPSGQLQLDFDEPDDDESEVTPQITRDWFELALQHEEAGELEASAKAYHKALLGRPPEPEICFNLGNVLYGLDRKEAASQRFMQAVELDPEYVEAWNNLGNVLAELGRDEEAIEAYQSALRVEPGYADAHFNLAETLDGLKRSEDARRHWQAYLRLDPHSSEAKLIAERLQSQPVDSHSSTDRPRGPRLDLD